MLCVLVPSYNDFNSSRSHSHIMPLPFLILPTIYFLFLSLNGKGTILKQGIRLEIKLKSGESRSSLARELTFGCYMSFKLVI